MANLSDLIRVLSPTENYGEDTGTANAYSVTLSSTYTAHVIGLPITFKASNTNTDTSTLNVNGLGAVDIRKNVNQILTPGDIITGQQIMVVYDGTYFQLISRGHINQIQSITASVDSSALTLNYNGGVLDFRNAALTSGVPTLGVSIPPLSLVVPSGATLGTVNTVQTMLALIILYNSGTPVLGVVNMSGGVNLDETTLLSTTAISDTADLSTVIYSTNAISDSPFRIVGYINITEATAGTWATAPTLIQGHGGQAMAAMMSLGYGQTWQVFSVGVDRLSGTTYYNTTGRPIIVNVAEHSGSGVIGMALSPTVNGAALPHSSANASFSSAYVSFIVPAGGAYSVDIVGAGTCYWQEFR